MAGLPYTIRSYYLDETVIELTGKGTLKCDSIRLGCASADIPDTCIYLEKDSSGNKVFGMDALGRVWVASQIHTGVKTPLITEISPIYGQAGGGDTITIYGANFTDAVQVTIDGNNCTNETFVSAGEITCDTPAGSSGSAKDLVVTIPNAGRFVMSNAFTYYDAPTVTACSPSSGNAGTDITLTGTGFQIGATVSINSQACTSVIWHNATEIVCRTPANANAAYDIVVTNPDGQSGTLVSGFEYVTCPTVTVCDPWFGLTAGGESVEITGTNFVAGATVTFGGSAATGVSVDSATTITCTTPARGNAGLVNVVVTNADGGIGTGRNKFEYFAQTLQTHTDDAGVSVVEWDATSGQVMIFSNSDGVFKLVGSVETGY